MRCFAFLWYNALSALTFKSLCVCVSCKPYSMPLPFLWQWWHFQTFVPACLSAAAASFLTIKSGSREETGWRWKDERRDGWREREVHGRAERGVDALGTVVTVVINKFAWGALPRVWVQYLLPQSCWQCYGIFICTALLSQTLTPAALPSLVINTPSIIIVSTSGWLK